MTELARMTGRTLGLALLLATITLFPGISDAQVKLSKSQQGELSQCLVGCKKGDAGCQDACMKDTTPADYAKSAGSCVRTCADALAGPGNKNNQADDMVKCVQACK